MPITLHKHQQEWVDKIKAALTRRKSVLGQAPTGFGKSFIAAYIAGGAIKKGKRVFFLVDIKQLCQQTSKEFIKNDVSHSFIAAGRKHDPSKLINVVMIQTLLSRMESVTPPDLLLYDEAHGAKSEGGDDVIKWVIANGGKVIGLTATPEPTDGSGLNKQFEEMVEGPDMGWLIANGYLSPYEMYVPEVTPDMSGVDVVMGDYVQEQVELIVNTPKIAGDTIGDYRRLAHNKACLVFCNSVKHAHDLAKQFCEAGYKFVAIDSDTDDDVRIKAFEDLENRIIHGITNYGICIKGVDIPLVECVIIQRATKSLIVWLQAIGRGLRFVKNKTCVILDQTGNVFRLGTPCMKREWSLEGRKKRKASDTPKPMPLRHCKGCKAIYDALLPKCPRCGSEHVIEQKKEKTSKKELKKITPEQVAEIMAERKKKKMEEGMAKTYAEFLALGIKRGYDNPRAWAMIRMKARKHG